MGKVITLKRREPKPRRRRLSLSLADPLLAQVERDARRSGISVQDYLRLAASFLLDQRAERRGVSR